MRGLVSGILGRYKIGEAVASQLDYVVNYVQLKGKKDILLTGQTISIENYDTAVLSVDFEPLKPRFSTSDSLFADMDIKYRVINLQGLIRIEQPTEGHTPETTVYRYDYDSYKGRCRGSIERCDED